ncbi:hypothetical protein PTKIN_Ptkin16aG0103800 [Pterospermum kingtungense]
MEHRCLVLRMGGHWEGITYVGGTDDSIILSPNFSYQDLLSVVNRVIYGGGSNYNFEIRGLMKRKTGNIVRHLITTEADFEHLLSRSPDEDAIVYVSMKQSQPSMSFIPMAYNPGRGCSGQALNGLPVYPSQPLDTPPPYSSSYFNHGYFAIPNLNPEMGTERQFRMNESFVQLMNQQIPLVNPNSGSQFAACDMNDTAHRVEESRDVNSRVIGEIAEMVVEGCSREPVELESFPTVDLGIDALHDNEISSNFDGELFSMDNGRINEAADATENEQVREQNIEQVADVPHNEQVRREHNVPYNEVSDVIDENQVGDNICLDNIERTDNRRVMSYPGFTQYSISEINTASSSTSDHELYVDAEFMSKDDLIMCIGKRALKERFEFRVKRSSKTRYVASCVVEYCTFEVRAVGVGNLWKVKKFVKEHTCHSDLGRQAARRILGKIISKLIAPKLLDKGRVICPCEVRSDLKSDHGFDILYSKAWRAKEVTERSVLEDADTSYQLLPSYLHMVKEANPGSIVDVQTN